MTDHCPTCGAAVRIEASGTTHYMVPIADERNRSRIRELEAHFNKAQKSLNFFLCLVNESKGVAGWHLNGDIAPWGDWQDEIDAAFAAAGEPPR